MTVESLAHSLQARKTGPSTWMARCPAHDDSNPSLAISEKHGKVVVHCHGGCGQRDVIEALKHRGVWQNGAVLSGPKDWPSRITATYDYHDEHGNVLYKVTRHEPTPEERKPFRPWVEETSGEWKSRKHPRQVLYHLPEVLLSRIVFVVEGERDADSLRARGFCGTTKSGGAKSAWLDSYTEALRGRHVIAIPDNDQPGKECVLRTVSALRGAVLQMTVLELRDGKDITDWFTLGHNETELLSLIESRETRH